jgi:TolB-like protein/class 3 adenylate cyclase
MSGHRKIAAILIADIVGYSRLTSVDEERTLTRVRAIQSDVIDPAIAAHNGRLVKRTGDGALVEFRSVVEAARCAIEIQDAMHERNAGVEDDRRIDFRMGLHLGDVIEEDDGDLMGDGVNIAARLEGLAAPGAVYLSEDAYRQVRSRLDVGVTDIGEKQLKNIAEPLRVYALNVRAPAEPKAMPTASAPGAAFNKPSIAVLPFTNMSGDAEQEYFVDGMVEDIITALSRFDELSVIARNSTFVYKGRAVEIRQVSRDLGVRYVLEGSVRKAGDRVRITGQLIDAATGVHLWADKFDGRLEDVFELQDQITANVVGALEPTMRKAEIERARRKPAEHMGAYDLYLQALPHIYAIRPDENLQALGLLERAIELDGNYATALAHAAWCLVQRTTRAWPAYGDNDVALAVSWARRALAIGSDDAKAVVLGGFVLVMLRQDYVVGMDAVSRAVEMNPGSGFVNAMAGCALIFGDEIEAGLPLLDRAMSLCPKDPNFFSFLTVAAVGRLFLGEPEGAIELANRSLALNACWDSTYWVLVTSYHTLGRTEEAKIAAKELLAVNPAACTSSYERVLPIRNPQSRAMVIQSLRDTGVPD